VTAEKLYLCELADIADPGSRGFSLQHKDEVTVFVVRHQNQVYGYLNRCPHTGAPLEWKPDQFLDFENRFIQCAMHGALFEIESGYCLRGPCAGHSLQKQQLVIEGETVYLLKNKESKADTAPD
jgi:nitrite reductase/ring-hydroxylating ferredoxin subunit